MKRNLLKDKTYEDEQNYGRNSWFYLSRDETADGDVGGHSQPYLWNPWSHFEGEEYSEFEKFLLAYKDTYPDDVRQIVYRLDIIKREGAADRHFRYEGKMRDRVMALPSHLETTSLRLYLLNIQAKILILGNGGLKTKATYQEDNHLHKCVKTLQKIDIKMKEREKQKVIVITGTELFGELSFTINDE